MTAWCVLACLSASSLARIVCLQGCAVLCCVLLLVLLRFAMRRKLQCKKLQCKKNAMPKTTAMQTPLQRKNKCNAKKRSPGGDVGLVFQGIPIQTNPGGRFWAAFPRNSYRNEPPGGDSGVLFQGTIETSPRGRIWATFPRNSYRYEPPGAILGCFSKEFL